MGDRHASVNSTSAATAKPEMSSEAYRQMLVKDGERRFQEWHQSFLRYQTEFLRQMRDRQVR